MFNSIKAKVITVFSLIMASFTILLLCIFYISERDQLVNLELEKSTEISQLHAQSLSQEFEQYVEILKVMKNTYDLQQADSKIILRSLNQLLKVGEGDFINAAFVDQNFNLTDISGETRKVAHPLFIHGDMRDHKDYNITVPIHASFTNEPVIVVSVPILNEQQKWQGALAVAVPLTLISERLSAIKLAKESYAWLSDANGLIVSHPIKEVIMSTSLSTTENPDFPGFYKIVKQTQSNQNGYGEYYDTKLAEDKIVTFSSIEVLPKWTLFVTTEKSEIFSNIDKLLYRIVIISCLLMLFYLFVIAHLANKIAKPISLLTKQVKKAINCPNNEFKMVNAKDEIGQLSEAFYISFKKINAYTSSLEEMVSQRTLEISTKNTQLNEQNSELEKLASIDALTQLYNRRAFMEYVNKELSRAKRHATPVTLAILDIDRFKSINDSYGHNIGDDILQKLAEQLTLNIRNEDVVSRWGGEEFVILMAKTTSQQAYAHLNHIRELISKFDFSLNNNITFSAGMADYQPGESFESWSHRADQALYKAKASGRNCIVQG